ncbi:uncharacterized protein [Diadema setosum]|uniref:uncharacterized protein n=1 Tax=Diadema setosum TaxID=31175 RepID=UPI003B3BD31E
MVMRDDYGLANPALNDNDSWNDELSSDQSLDQRREAVRRAINQINLDRVNGRRGPPSVIWNTGQQARGFTGRPADFMTPYVVDGSVASVGSRRREYGARPMDFTTPYVADGSEASFASNRTHVERNPLHDNGYHQYY